MPLPANGTQWPPANLTEEVLPRMAEWDSWYVGDPARLAGTTGSRNTFQSDGLVGVVRSFFWGKPRTTEGVDNRLHIPVASDIAQASADLLFSEPPTATVDDEKLQARLDLITDDEFLDTLASSAEVSAVLGGTYLVATTDPSMPNAFVTRMDADRAIPTFKWGRLQAVTFWTTLPSDSGTLRYVEAHELDSFGVGVVRHGLYMGTGTSIGHAVPLADHAVTAPLADVVDEQATVSTGTPGLDVVYIPNMGPNRRWRNHPAGRNLGRSDLDGIEHLMDALDETYSSLMRDVRLGKSMLIVPQYMVENNGPGKGVMFGQEEVYAPVKMNAVSDPSKIPVEQVQFAIRVEEHLRVASDLFAKILRSAGYSAQTFGEGSLDGPAATATEIVSRERRSYITRDRKIRPFKPGLERILDKALGMDALAYGGSVGDNRVSVAFGDAIQESPLSLATTAQALRAAEAASTRTLVQMQHPDWDEAALDEEVALIVADRGSAFTDPDTIGLDGANLSNQFGGNEDAGSA